jgi:hypothetical protein
VLAPALNGSLCHAAVKILSCLTAGTVRNRMQDWPAARCRQVGQGQRPPGRTARRGSDEARTSARRKRRMAVGKKSVSIKLQMYLLVVQDQEAHSSQIKQHIHVTMVLCNLQNSFVPLTSFLLRAWLNLFLTGTVCKKHVSQPTFPTSLLQQWTEAGLLSCDQLHKGAVDRV